jgi:hypothetical protein
MTLASNTQQAPVYTEGRRLRVVCSRGLDRRTESAPRPLNERRGGYDRRRSYALTGVLRDNALALLGVLFVINALSLVDLAFVLDAAGTVGRHAHPVLADVVSQDVGQAWVLKAGVMLAVSWGIWRERRRRAVLGTALFALVASLAVVAVRLAIAV